MTKVQLMATALDDLQMNIFVNNPNINILCFLAGQFHPWIFNNLSNLATFSNMELNISNFWFFKFTFLWAIIKGFVKIQKWAEFEFSKIVLDKKKRKTVIKIFFLKDRMHRQIDYTMQ